MYYTRRTLLLCLVVLSPSGRHLVAADQLSGVATEKEPAAQKASLFDGKTLDGWKVLTIHDFEKHGKVTVKKGEITLGQGRPATGISYQGEFPKQDYEVSLESKRVEGGDFFCGMTFPIGKDYCTLIIGGWGGGVTGLSNIDDQSAVENETTDYIDFKQDRWYRIRLRVTPQRIQAWVDDANIVDVKTTDRKFSIWWEQEPVRPFGIASWNTAGALRDIQLTRIGKQPAEPPND